LAASKMNVFIGGDITCEVIGLLLVK